jgi:cytochrome c oxidase subunit 2
MPIASERDVLRSEFRWGLLTAAAVGLIFLAILTAALTWQINPPSNVEFIDPKTLHLSGEFTEDNLGTQVQGNAVVHRVD